jgi:predicted MPP superfamily phosphohydrolase
MIHLSFFKSRRFKILIAACLLCGLALGAWAFWIEPNRLVVKQTEIKLPGWPESLNRLRIVAISDLHVGSLYITLDKLERVVETINAAKPDIVVLLGDYVIQDVVGGRFIEPEVFAEKLKALRAPGGVVAVLGNHDWWYDAPRVRRALEQAGMHVLEDEAVPIQHRGQVLWLAGLVDLWKGKPDIEKAMSQVPQGAPMIMLTHNPDIFPQVPPRVSLTVAGHTHGGQVNLPFVGRLVVPSQFGQRYAIGHIQENKRHLFVTPGIGTSIFPVRFRVPPEISVVTLVAQPASD